MRATASILVGLCMFAAPAFAGGTVRGNVQYAGDPPAPEKVEVAQDPETCGTHEIFPEELLVSKDGGLRNVVLTIEGVTGGRKLEVPSEPIAFDQERCVFTEHVAVVPAGARVEFRNSDPIVHNVHLFSRKNTPFNRDVQPGKTYVYTVERTEKIRVTCDRHPWMKAYVVAVDTPYWAKSGEDGAFAIGDLPPGNYTIATWHETLGKGPSVQVEVPANGDAAPLEIEFAPKG